MFYVEILRISTFAFGCEVHTVARGLCTKSDFVLLFGILDMKPVELTHHNSMVGNFTKFHIESAYFGA